MAVVCRHCGCNIVGEGALYCINCGKLLDDSMAVVCKHCGWKNVGEGASYCVNCGKLLDGKEERKVITEKEYNSMTEALKHSSTLISELNAEKEELSARVSKLNVQIAELNAKQNKLYVEGYAPSGKCLISNWAMWLVGVVFIGCLGWYSLSGNLTSSGFSDKVVEERKLSLPDDLTGNYMVKELNGKDGNNSIAKILQEEGQYSMSVYSSSITRKYFFAYNPETGILSSEELGNGKVEYVGKINQIKISFEGWILVK